MRFFTVIVTSMVLALSVSAAPSILQPRALTAKQMVDNINIITNMSAQLQPIVQNIRLSPFEKRQFNSFQPVIKGFQSIIQVAQKDNQAMQGTEPYGDDDAQLVCEAFRGFVRVHQQLLNILIGKSGLLQSLFLGPVAAILRALEAVVDTLAFGIINTVPGCRDMAMQDKDDLDKTLGQAERAFTPLGSLLGGS